MADEVKTNPDSPEGGPVFHLDFQGCSATGVWSPNGRFLVHAGAVGRADTVESFSTSVKKYKEERDRLIDKGALSVEGDRVVMTQDTLFQNATYATSILSGRRQYGYEVWKTDSGQTLRDYRDNWRTLGSSSPNFAAEQGHVYPRELELRRSWFTAHHWRFRADEVHYQQSKAATDGFTASADEALSLLDDLRTTGDLTSFNDRMKRWSKKPGTLAFDGINGQGLLNQLVKKTEDPQLLAGLLAESLIAPESDDEAATKIQSLVDYVEEIRVGAHPAPGHVPFLLSYFWGLADRARWPVMWPSFAAFVEFSTGEGLPLDLAERYRTFVERVRELDADTDEIERTAAWWKDKRPVFLDKVLCQRVELGLDHEGASLAERRTSAQAMVSVAQFWGTQLFGDVSEALGPDLTVNTSKPNLSTSGTWDDVWVDWGAKGASGLSFRVWVNEQGAAVAVRPGLVRKGWWGEVVPIFERADYPTCRILGGPSSRIGDDVGLTGAHGAEFVYGQWFDREEFADVELRAEVAELAEQLKPLFDQLLALAKGESAGPVGDPLEEAVAKFIAEHGYSTEWMDDDREFQRRTAGILARDAIDDADPNDIRLIWSGKRGTYGGTGVMPQLNKSFPAEPTEEQYERMINTIRYLCWGDGSDAERIDRVLDRNGEFYIPGLGESVIMKFLAMTKPEVYGLIYPYHGGAGKQVMLRNLGLAEPSGTAGEVQVEANNLLRTRLEPFFPGDPCGMMQFLYWYPGVAEDGDLESALEDEGDSDRDVIGELAEELLVEREFIEDIIDLLNDKGQVIFYGPPGTGKTYLAQKLAEALTSDESHQRLVQFHPSSSYEDFFEGFRPEVDDGQMTYRLTPGPLRLMAQKASNAPGRQHLMIIDEINRANLPKVFGELLFLLEYRGESVYPLYRPEEEFSLPPNLWFIGTMNTADRSIALIDAALRRRFHFVPFFPDRPPVEGLLDRWLAENNEPDWVGEVVAQVNDELEKELGGSHLLLGPSHFMKKNLDKGAVGRIWKYNIEPFIEDQFFGNRQQIDNFRFDAVYERYMDQSGRAEMAEQEAAAQEAGEVEPFGQADASPLQPQEGLVTEGNEAETPDS